MKKSTNQNELIQQLKSQGTLAVQNVDVKVTKHVMKEYSRLKLIDVGDFRTTRYPVTELYKSISRVL
jgi:hypothetical protein